MRNYDKEFKEEAVQLAMEIGISEAADKLDIPKSTLAGWKRKYNDYEKNAFVGSGNRRIKPSDLEKMKLQKEIKELKMANDILKKALGFLAESQKK
jgi:transposase